ncbi:hypothetical protein LJC46_07540 [Desulfovibrio sp. OttesenSCG-928-G15]|nr:hypothetical protein [Desulfovibrio sp. OttesenSCG-928-G15]
MEITDSIFVLRKNLFFSSETFEATKSLAFERSVAMSAVKYTLTYEELDKAREYISDRYDFAVLGVLGNMMDCVKKLEKMIEDQNRTCRIYSAKRSAGLIGAIIPTGITQLLALGTAVSIVAHNLVTYNPDYEIVRDFTNNSVSVYCKK